MSDYLDVIYLSGGQSSSMRSSLRQEKNNKITTADKRLNNEMKNKKM